MSTRCQILFQEICLRKDETGKEKAWNYEAQIYRHSDGYPEDGVLDDLEEFFDWNEGRNEDVSYTAANFIYYMKRGMERYILQFSKEKNPNYKSKDGKSFVQAGYGVEKADHQIHGDEEYLYRITVHDDRRPDFRGWKIEVAPVSYGDDVTFDNANYTDVYELTKGADIRKVN